MLAKVSAAVNFLQRMELPQASRAANEALQLAPNNSYLHFLNGFVYHLQARQGDTQKSDMAVEGYQQALRIDPGNWIAQEFLGLAFLEQHKFDAAKAQFSEVLLLTSDSTVSMYGLMMASYLTGDAVTACAMADIYRKTLSAPSVGFVRSSVSVYASCGEFDKADQMRAHMAAQNGSTADGARVDQRLAQWKSFYRRQAQGARVDAAGPVGGFVPTSLNYTTTVAPALQLAQAFAVPAMKPSALSRPAPPAAPANAVVPTPPAPGDVKPASEGAGGAESGPRMTLVDVVLVSTQELMTTSKGVNLLNALTLQLGSAVGNLAAYSRVIGSSAVGTAEATVTTAITRAVTVPALSYSLNIANANNSVNEVLARPTLAAIEGMPSEFFSGTNLSAGVVSTSVQGGTTIVPLEKRFGIKLAVTPTFLSNGKVQLKVEAQRTSLNATNENPRVAYQIEIAETTANANVVMNLGDTLVLSGLTEKSTSSTRDGVPVLQDVPVAQYLFSNKRTNDIQRSVLILITPRAAGDVQPDPGQSAAMTSSMRALREQFGISVGSTPNVQAVFNSLKANALFREFRQGDVSMDRWDHVRTTGERLRQALDFLYY